LKAEEIVLRKLTVAVVSAFILLVPAVPAHAAVSPSVSQVSPADALRVRGEHIVAAARAQRGKPYRFGATGPRAFDCSGLTGYVYRTVHIALPRTAQQQYRAARPVSRAEARPGDLVFWLHGRHAYHVGVYAGGGRVWHAPKQGDRVKLARIWGRVHYGRIA
jgi:cell wall-associated NlpC family hydrolase